MLLWSMFRPKASFERINLWAAAAWASRWWAAP
jgi:hypothetical protein